MPSPSFAIIGGSAGHQVLASRLGGAERLGTRTTPFGYSQPVYRFENEDAAVFFLPRHGEAGYSLTASFVNYRANVWALRELGAKKVLAWSGPGAIDVSLEVGGLVLPDDLLDETRTRKQTFFENMGLGFIRQSPVFCPDLSERITRIAEAQGVRLRRGGTYVCTEGPRLETPAEIRKYAALGAHLVGMTLAPECFLAKELEMCYVPLCYVTNYAEGVRPAAYRPGVLFEGLLSDEQKPRVDKALEEIVDFALSLARAVKESTPNCLCHRSMERYRLRGDIGEDWRRWINNTAREGQPA